MSSQASISITVPISRVYLDMYRTYWQQLGCQVETSDTSPYCKITFPPGTRREGGKKGLVPRFLLRLPNETTIEEVQGYNCSYLYTNTGS